MRYLYLHGFASGPQSLKARRFKAALSSRGFDLAIPDLARGDFEHLTISGQLDLLAENLAGEPARLVGSSMGAYVAALYASAHPEIDRLVLLAPAFEFSTRWRVIAGPEKLSHWGESGWLEVFHYGEKAMSRVHFGLFENALRYPASPDFRQPALIFHGVRDAMVPVELSRAFASSHPNAALTELDSDHELLDVLDQISAAAIPFLIDPDVEKTKPSGSTALLNS